MGNRYYISEWIKAPQRPQTIERSDKENENISETEQWLEQNQSRQGHCYHRCCCRDSCCCCHSCCLFWNTNDKGNIPGTHFLFSSLSEFYLCFFLYYMHDILSVLSQYRPYCTICITKLVKIIYRYTFYSA